MNQRQFLKTCALAAAILSLIYLANAAGVTGLPSRVSTLESDLKSVSSRLTDLTLTSARIDENVRFLREQVRAQPTRPSSPGKTHNRDFDDEVAQTR